MSSFLQPKVLLFLTIWCIEITYSSRKVCPTYTSTKLLNSSTYSLYYVDAKWGNDRWSGTILKPNSAESNGPFRTITGAINGIRKNRARRRNGKPKVLYVRKGTYYIDRTIDLKRKDSNLMIIGYPNESKPLLSGGIKIPGNTFRQIDDKIWAAPYTGRCSWNVYLGTKRLVRSRKPNLKSWKGNELSGEGPYLTIKDLLVSTKHCNRAGTGGFMQKCPPQNKHGFVFHEGDINPEWINSGQTSGYIVVFHSWNAERGHIGEITKDNKVLFSSPLKKPVGTSPKPSGWRYIVENVKEELDAVGEFFCDEQKQMMYIVPPKGALKTEDIFVAQTLSLFKIVLANNLKFSGLNFRYTDVTSSHECDVRPAALEFSKCNQIKIRQCDFRNIACTAVHLGSTINSEVTDCKFYDIGYYGISTAIRKNPKNKFATKNILIQGNTLKGCGVTYMLQPSCMFIQGVRNIKIIQNDVSKTPYAAIQIGWQTTFTRDYLPKGEYVFTVSGNKLHNYGRKVLNDFAGVYISSNRHCVTSNGNTAQCHLPSLVQGNVVYGAACYHYGAHALRGDTAASSLTFKNNWMYYIESASINFHCGQNNKAINNMIYHTSNQGVLQTCHTIAGQHVIPIQILAFVRNVIYVANGRALMFTKDDDWTRKVPVVNQTDYFFNPKNDETFDIFFPKYRSWEQWKDQTGNDKESIIADPMFFNITTRDFRLKEESPALKIGIKSVDLRRVQSSSGACIKRSKIRKKIQPTTPRNTLT